MRKKVFVTGIGIITALGDSVSTNRKALIAGETGIGKAQFLNSRYTDVFPFGEVPFSTTELKSRLDFQDKDELTRTDILAFLACRDAIQDSCLSKNQLSAYETAFISASTVGGMMMTDELYADVTLKGEPSTYLSSYLCGSHTREIMRHYNMKGYSTTFNTACSSSANAIMFGAKLIKSGKANRAIVGGTDALAKFTVNGFNALRILSEEPCKPFDENRTGLTLGEGAAYLILESEDVVGDKKIYAEVSGYGNANDAFHASSISDEAIGVIEAISEAIRIAQISPSEIGYINAHGTGTPNNDVTELTGLKKIFTEIPPFQSTKSYTGHTLGAAGAIEAVFSLMAMENNEIYQSLHYQTPIQEHGLNPILQYQQNVEIKHVLSNSFGFGGNCSSLLFSKI